MPLQFAAVEVGDSLQQGLDNLIGFLPKLIGFLIILAIGYIIARVVKGIVTKLLEKIGTDRAMHTGTTGEYINRVAPGFQPSSVVGAICFWFIFLGALAVAVSQLGIDALDNFVVAVGGYLPNVLAAVLIFVVAVALSGTVGALISRTMGDTPTGKVLGVGRAGPDHGHRDLHGARPARDRSGHRDDHVCRAARRHLPRDGAGLRARRPRCRGSHAL